MWDSWVPNTEQVYGKIRGRVDVQEDESRAPDIVSRDQGLYDRDHGVRPSYWAHPSSSARKNTKTLSRCYHTLDVPPALAQFDSRTSCAPHSTGDDRPSMALAVNVFHVHYTARVATKSDACGVGPCISMHVQKS